MKAGWTAPVYGADRRTRRKILAPVKGSPEVERLDQLIEGRKSDQSLFSSCGAAYVDGSTAASVYIPQDAVALHFESAASSEPRGKKTEFCQGERGNAVALLRRCGSGLCNEYSTVEEKQLWG
ncbi:hypothetical protein C8J57DRAFT_1212763 [Mycena rebaudengoi]|nr:hypothetical protein C8J57DRAFT_1212763 [Mycena rebaudengoi]